jgi:hypothetical protein
VLALLVPLLGAADPSSVAPTFPIYPGSSRTTVVAAGDSAAGMFQTSASPPQVRQWYVDALPNAGWTFTNPDRSQKYDSMWRLQASHSATG